MAEDPRHGLPEHIALMENHVTEMLMQKVMEVVSALLRSGHLRWNGLPDVGQVALLMNKFVKDHLDLRSFVEDAYAAGRCAGGAWRQTFRSSTDGP
jgi:hypothetical protein